MLIYSRKEEELKIYNQECGLGKTSKSTLIIMSKAEKANELINLGKGEFKMN